MRTVKTTRTLDPGTRRMFSYLDGELGSGERAAFEAEMARDSGLAAEAESFRSLLATLDELAAFAPSPDFRARVLAALQTRKSWRLRLRGWLGGDYRPAARNVFAALLDEGLSARQARTLAAFVARDPEAATALASWRSLYEQLDGLSGFAPARGFADRVMFRLDAAPAPAAPWAVLAGGIRRLWPRRRERLAAATGIAFGPVVGVAGTVAGTTYMLFSNNPLVTASNVASFVWTKCAAALAGLAQGLFGGATTSPAAGSVVGLLDNLAQSAPAMAAGLLLFGGLTLVSTWILYKNVVKVSGMERRYVPV